MKLGLENKVIVVTGGASGIGEAIVRELLEEGALPIIVDRDEKKVVKLVKQLFKRYQKSPDFYIVDLSDPLLTEVALKEINQKYRRIYGLVNNAGTNDGVGLRASVQEFESSISNNLTHYFQMTKGLVDKIKKVEGSIVNISSKVAFTGQGGTSGYAASKGAINALTREWAVELAPFNVDVNCIIPAEVQTPQYTKWLSTDKNSGEKMKSIMRKVNLGHRLTLPKEIAYYTVFLLSDKNSHFTGQCVFVDGGYTHLDDSKEL